MSTHPKTYKSVTCPDCNKIETIRTDNKRIRCASCSKKGSLNPSIQKSKFIGTITEYKKYHARVNRTRGKADSCQFGCIANRYHWANISGKYDDIYDYTELCPSCHSLYDFGKLELL